MFFLRFLRLLLCLVLTIPCWFIAASFVVLLVNGEKPPSQQVSLMPNDVYYWLKKAVTNAAISTVAFFKNELF